MAGILNAVPNTSDGSAAPPRLRCYLNLMALEDLGASSAGPRAADPGELFEAIAAAGYEGVQIVAPLSFGQRAACARLKVGLASLGRVNEPPDADALAKRFQDEGVECATLHVGWGMEDDEQASRLIEAVLEASDRRGVPLYVETHRATVFQDMWRTVQFVKRFPGIRFNGDFSHWYTGLEMVYGGFAGKLRFIQPVLERVRFLHGRIGNPGCIQVDVGDGDPVLHPYVSDFQALWTASFEGFLRSARPGDYMLFVPELLGPRIYYSRLRRNAAGELEEECDRWRQSLVLRGIAEASFAAARFRSEETP